ncbi:MAG TPA: signal peptide peptidase SppA [Stellaceae bacterium]|nr:signal peptide peptidase SppA [Stellaceae bacterium]
MRLKKAGLVRRVVIGFFAVMGAIFVLLILVGVGLGVWLGREPAAHVADNTVLTLDLSGALPDQPSPHGLSQLLFPSGMSLADTLGALLKAGDDPRVKGVVARIGEGGMGFAEIQELRDAIAAFRAKGKRAIAYADTFGELSSGTRSYYLASAFDEIWLQPLGAVGLVGLRAEVPYFRGTLDKLGIVADFEHREEYKDAANPLTETAMPAAERDELQALLQSIYGQIVDGIAKDRKLSPDAVKQLVDRAPLLIDEAMKAHLIDHVGYREDALASFGAGASRLSLARYFDAVGAPHREGPTIALIYATGLMASDGGDNALIGSSVMSADAVTRAFRIARDDQSVRAILFRINSPGGSAVAAETVWKAVERTRAAGKPVIVSMGDVAGSGGYYIAAPASKIVAEPASLTGSIGVVAGKLAFGGLLKKLGGNSDSVQIGANAGMFSLMQDFTPSERERLIAVLDNIYATFKQRVSDGRKLDANAVEAVAKGRVWSGEDAKARGLVDALGGFRTALALAKQAAGVAASEDVTLKPYPPPKSAFEQLMARVSDGALSGAASLLPQQVASALHASLQQIASTLAPHGALTMPSFVLE